MAEVGRIFFFFQAEDGIRDYKVTGVQTCALPISLQTASRHIEGCRSLSCRQRRTITGPIDSSFTPPPRSRVPKLPNNICRVIPPRGTPLPSSHRLTAIRPVGVVFQLKTGHLCAADAPAHKPQAAR